MLRELLIGLALLQTLMCHSYITAWEQSISAARQLRLDILRQPNQTYRSYCQSPPQNIKLEFKVGGTWQSICQSGPEYRHRGRRYWRLIVSVKYEILGLTQRQIALEFKLFR